jgi:hypothetical protein
MPSVIAAMAGPRTAPATAITVCAVRTTGKLGVMAMARALMLSTPTPATTAARFQYVASMNAPRGA